MKLKRPLPKRAVIGGIVGAGVVVLLVGWFGLVGSQNGKAASLAKQSADVQQEIASNLAQIAAQKTASAVPTTPKIRVADVYKLAKAMPSSVDMPDILLELDQVGRDAGVRLQTISPSAPTGDGKINLTLTVEGDFFTVTDLLYRLRNFVSVRNGALEASGRLFDVDTVSLTPSGATAVTASITMHTYQYTSVPAAAVPAPVVTSSADTTSTPSDTTDTPPSGPSASGAP
jgi:Tfp pilus assembly protein PilO